MMIAAPSKSKQKKTKKKVSARKTPKANKQILDFVSAQLKSGGQDLEGAREVLRRKCKEDLWFLCYHVLGMPDICNELHLDMCERWEARRHWTFSLWMTPRFHLKTSLWTRGGCIQELLINPDQRILIINAKLENALDILSDIKADFETNDILRWLFPEYVIDFASRRMRQLCKWGVARLDFPCSKYAGRKEGNVQIMSVEASLVSKHYDLLIYDDPVNDDNTTTKVYRDKVQRWYQNSQNLRTDMNTRFRLIGTRWHFDDLYSRIIKQEADRRKRQRDRGEKIRPRYLIYHRQVVEKVEAGGQTIVGVSNAEPIWPERFGAEDIDEMKTDLGSYVFSCQMMNNPLPEEDAIFKYSDIKMIDYYDIPENVVNFITVDMAVEETEKGDFSVITVGSFDNQGKMYVRKVIRDKILPSKLLMHLNDLTKAYNVQRVGIETTAFQKTLYRVYKQWAVQKGYHIPWYEMNRGKSSKLKRILSMQPRVERGDFYIEEGIDNVDHVVDEMTTYPRSAHDDILDTLADLEALFIKAPQIEEEEEDYGSFDQVWGSLDDDEEDNEDLSSSVIDAEFCAWEDLAA